MRSSTLSLLCYAYWTASTQVIIVPENHFYPELRDFLREQLPSIEEHFLLFEEHFPHVKEANTVPEWVRGFEENLCYHRFDGIVLENANLYYLRHHLNLLGDIEKNEDTTIKGLNTGMSQYLNDSASKEKDPFYHFIQNAKTLSFRVLQWCFTNATSDVCKELQDQLRKLLPPKEPTPEQMALMPEIKRSVFSILEPLRNVSFAETIAKKQQSQLSFAVMGANHAEEVHRMLSNKGIQAEILQVDDLSVQDSYEIPKRKIQEMIGGKLRSVASANSSEKI